MINELTLRGSLIGSWVCSLMVISLSPLRDTYLRKSFATIVVHMTSKVLHVPLGLVEVRASLSGHP